MPTRSQKSLFVLSDAVSSVLGDLAIWSEMMALSISHRSEHLSPNMAVLSMIVRKSRNVSQMEMGTNRTKRENKPIFENVDKLLPSGNRSGWFSIIANVEQGGRKTDIPVAFLEYVATILNVPISVIQDANAEDAAIRAAFLAANK